MYKRQGDKVKAGDLLAEVDLAYLKEREINPITPVLVCGGLNGQQLSGTEGPVQAGKTVLMETAETVVTAGCTVRNQRLWCMDREFFFHITDPGTVHLRNPGASAAAVRPASYADHSDELLSLIHI